MPIYPPNKHSLVWNWNYTAVPGLADPWPLAENHRWLAAPSTPPALPRWCPSSARSNHTVCSGTSHYVLASHGTACACKTACQPIYRVPAAWNSTRHGEHTSDTTAGGLLCRREPGAAGQRWDQLCSCNVKGRPAQNNMGQQQQNLVRSVLSCIGIGSSWLAALGSAWLESARPATGRLTQRPGGRMRTARKVPQGRPNPDAARANGQLPQPQLPQAILG
jgi:hypothetical protein